MSAFRRELTQLLNRHCCESESDTPDFALATFIVGALRAFDDAVHERERYYGRRIGEPHYRLTPKGEAALKGEE